MKMKVLHACIKKKKTNKQGKKNHHKVETSPTADWSETDEGGSLQNLEMRDEKQPFIGPDGSIINRYSKDVEGSALAMFARVSCTIGKTLTEEEFGSTQHTNDLYRPSSIQREIQVVYPVVCKRDIFLRSVTQNRKMGCKKSPYHFPIISNETSLTRDDRIKQESSFPDSKKNEGLKSSTDLMKNNAFMPSYSISSSMLFRNNNQLKIETGRIASDEPQAMHAKLERLFNASPEQHNGRMARDYGKPPRLANISPSSTISSISLCPDLETPRIPIKSPAPKSSLVSHTPLEGIKEIGGIIMSEGSNSIEKDYSEI